MFKTLDSRQKSVQGSCLIIFIFPMEIYCCSVWIDFPRMSSELFVITSVTVVIFVSLWFHSLVLLILILIFKVMSELWANSLNFIFWLLLRFLKKKTGLNISLNFGLKNQFLSRKTTTEHSISVWGMCLQMSSTLSWNKSKFFTWLEREIK